MTKRETSVNVKEESVAADHWQSPGQMSASIHLIGIDQSRIEIATFLFHESRWVGKRKSNKSKFLRNQLEEKKK